MDSKPELRLIENGDNTTPIDNAHDHIEDHPARFFRYKDASNFYDLTGEKDA